MRIFSRSLACAASLALAGCYVIPIGADGRHFPLPARTVPVVPPPEFPLQFSARLYPENDTAAATGVLSGQVTNHLNGKGQFSVAVAGELLQGEATRTGRDSRRGVANAYGGRGATMRCEYMMNHPGQGTGTCVLGNGAHYRLHLGSP
jgi:hypothetical protein